MQAGELAALDAEIAAVKAKMWPLQQRLHYLENQRHRLASKSWVEENRIKREDVEMSHDKQKPWFGDVWKFLDWLKENSTKRYYEWNGSIYPASDASGSRVPMSPLASLDDLPE